MISGLKKVSPQQAIANAWRSVAAMMLAAVLAFWWVQWRAAPAPDQIAQPSTASEQQRERHRD
jgi:hypothetical protein